jgi:hypothetical protein
MYIIINVIGRLSTIEPERNQQARFQNSLCIRRTPERCEINGESLSGFSFKNLRQPSEIKLRAESSIIK